MPSQSKAQQRAAGAALAAKRGNESSSTLQGAAKNMYRSMSSKQLGHFARTKRKGLPRQKSLMVGMNTQGTTTSVGTPLAKACLRIEDAGQIILNQLLEDDERAEVGSARTILAALSRLQSSLPQASPGQQHDITIIRSAANALVRMHPAV